jgi:hypothetical protein
VSAIFFYNNKIAKNPIAKFTKDVRKMDDSQKEVLMDFIDAGLNGNEQVKVKVEPKSKEIRELLQDVSDEELRDLQEQTEDLQDVLMTN